MLNISDSFCSRVAAVEVVCTCSQHLTYHIYVFSCAIEVFPFHRDNMKAFGLGNQHVSYIYHIISLLIFFILLDMLV